MKFKQVTHCHRDSFATTAHWCFAHEIDLRERRPSHHLASACLWLATTPAPSEPTARRLPAPLGAATGMAATAGPDNHASETQPTNGAMAFAFLAALQPPIAEGQLASLRKSWCISRGHGSWV